MVNISSIDLKCTGCLACINTCPVGAITSRVNNDGFVYPSINEKLCTSCGKCLRICPKSDCFTLETNRISKCLLLQMKSDDALRKSASGGAFYLLAKKIIESGGYVCGCIINNANKPVHICTNNYDDLEKMQGSKYVQSYISNDIFKEVSLLLLQGETVLFSGTPCQVAAVRNMHKGVGNLVLIDLICHGVGSPGLFETHIHRIEKSLKEPIKEISFRSKERRRYPDTFHLKMAGEKRLYDKSELVDPYFAAFSSSRILRESCYTCSFSTNYRVGDITIGDYLVSSGIPESLPREKGISLACINTKTGEDMIQIIKNAAYIVELNNIPHKKNLERPEPRPKKRDILNELGYKDTRVLQRTMTDIIKSLLTSDQKERIKRMMSRVGAK